MPFAGQTIRALDFVPSVSTEEAANETGFSGITFVTGATVCGISFIAPTSGAGTIWWYCRFGSIDPSATNANVSIHVRTGATINSGTDISLSSEDSSLENSSAGIDSTENRLGAAMFRPLANLIAGQSYNAVMEHQVATGTATIFHRAMMWQPSP